jgi:hypothetical protein
MNEAKKQPQRASIESPYKRTLKELLKGWNQVFKSSEYQDLKILGWKATGKDKLILTINADVLSIKGKIAYKTIINLHRQDVKIAWTINLKCEVKCNCPAFRYFLAHPDLRVKNLFGRPSDWNKVKNKEKNVSLIPGICKHLVKVTDSLVEKNTIKLI